MEQLERIADEILVGNEVGLLIRLGVALLCGFIIGVERESRGKAAGISTNSFVIGGAAMFTFLSLSVDPSSPARIAAQIVSGVGFLGAGMILKGEGGVVQNLTTAAGIWFSAAIGMSIGFGWYVVAVAATLYSVIVPRIPHVKRRRERKPADE